MEQKKKLQEQLKIELEALKKRRDELLVKVDDTRQQYNEEYPSAVLDDYILELQSVVNNICDLENTLKNMRNADKLKKLGEMVKVGDCVTLKNHSHLRQYYIASDKEYINPNIGIISNNSPIGQKLLHSKFGEKIALLLNGAEQEYLLLP